MPLPGGLQQGGSGGRAWSGYAGRVRRPRRLEAQAAERKGGALLGHLKEKPIQVKVHILSHGATALMYTAVAGRGARGFRANGCGSILIYEATALILDI